MVVWVCAPIMARTFARSKRPTTILSSREDDMAESADLRECLKRRRRRHDGSRDRWHGQRLEGKPLYDELA